MTNAASSTRRPYFQVLTERLKRRMGLDVAMGEVRGDDHIEIGGRKLFYQERGDPSSPAVLYLHGSGAFPAELPPILDGFAERGFYALAPEHPGMGRSEHLNHSTLGLFEGFALAYRELLERKGVTEPIVVAQSFGAVPAHGLAAFAERVPSDVHTPRALVLVDCFMAESPAEKGLSGLAGRLLQNFFGSRLPSRRWRHHTTSFWSGTPAEYYRDDTERDLELASTLGTMLRQYARGYPLVDFSYENFILSGTRERPLILVWGERDGIAILDNGQWGTKLTTIGDARRLHARVQLAVASQTSPQLATTLVRMSVIPSAGHNGLHTRSNMNVYLDVIVKNLKEAGIEG